ncbi:Cystatin-related plant [Arabidopsis suecica]|uniref:Cystatin-related plant n=1 Tax=Arabidopsis suecica TaxID=45249 RepID=A0A8T2AN02_ARASU|nr:Cystatin-related plant [Arabidopsis suecica]
MIAFFLHHRRQWKRESFDLLSIVSLSPSPPSVSGFILVEEESASTSITLLFCLVWLVKIWRRATPNQQIKRRTSWITSSFCGTCTSYITFMARESEEEDTLVQYQAKVAKKLTRKSYPIFCRPSPKLDQDL